MATLVHAIVTSRIDYCNVLLVDALKATNDKLQCLLNAAAHLVSDTRKFDRGLRQLMNVDRHWLDVPERVKFKLVSMVPSSQGSPVLDGLLHSALRSTRRHYLVVPAQLPWSDA